MIRVTIGAMTVQADTQAELDTALGCLSATLGDKEMAALADVSERTVRRWKSSPQFPRPKSGKITRSDFLAFLFNIFPAKIGQ